MLDRRLHRDRRLRRPVDRPRLRYRQARRSTPIPRSDESSPAGAADIERAATTIGDYVHVGAARGDLMGCSIGDHSVIGAGAVVPQFTTVPEWSLRRRRSRGVIYEGAARRFAANAIMTQAMQPDPR